MSDSRRRAEEAATDIRVCLKGRGVTPQIMRHTETLVSACVCAGAKPLPDGYGEYQGVIPDPLSEVGSTHPWSSPENTRIPVQGEQRDPIGGGGGGIGTSHTPTQGGRTHPPPLRALQTVATVVVPQGEVKYPPAEGVMAVTGRPITEHVAHRGDPPGNGMDGPGPTSKGDHRHTRHWHVRDPVEDGGGKY